MEVAFPIDRDSSFGKTCFFVTGISEKVEAMKRKLEKLRTEKRSEKLYRHIGQIQTREGLDINIAVEHRSLSIDKDYLRSDITGGIVLFVDRDLAFLEMEGVCDELHGTGEGCELCASRCSNALEIFKKLLGPEENVLFFLE